MPKSASDEYKSMGTTRFFQTASLLFPPTVFSFKKKSRPLLHTSLLPLTDRMSPRKRRTNFSPKKAAAKKAAAKKASPKKASSTAATNKPVPRRPVVLVPAGIIKRKTVLSKVASLASVSSVHSLVPTEVDSHQPSPAPGAPAPAPLTAQESLWTQVRRELEEDEAKERRRVAALTESQTIFRVQVAKMMKSKLWVDAHMNAADEEGVFESSRSCSVDRSGSESATLRGDSPASDHESTPQPEFMEGPSRRQITPQPEFVEGPSRRQITPQPQFVEGSSRIVLHPLPGFTPRRFERLRRA
ncbi:hypothetical protein B0H21DRAFT_722071 [Amylocystis lapponica]|nr:hypothetical protein B0H21DRAFT_722071 [Amylocystis lapponica]